MRIATWNVNSLKARLEKVSWWIDRAKPDVLLMQETKLADAEAPHVMFQSLGYELAHHGEGRWNGVAIASRTGISDIITNFGEPLAPPRTPDVSDDEPLAEARMISAVCGGVRLVSVYAPNGRVLNSTSYEAKLASVRAAGAFGLRKLRIRSSRSAWVAISTLHPKTPTSGIRPPVTAARTYRTANDGRSENFAIGDWWMPTG